MARRREPWDEYEILHQRLESWAQWVRAEYPEMMGWNVYKGDTASGLRVQMRNDTHSDKVFSEVAHMDRDERRNFETDRAWRELPSLWRTLIWLLYVDRDRYGKSDLANRTGIDHRDVSTHLWHAFRELDIIVQSTRFRHADTA